MTYFVIGIKDQAKNYQQNIIFSLLSTPCTPLFSLRFFSLLLFFVCVTDFFLHVAVLFCHYLLLLNVLLFIEACNAISFFLLHLTVCFVLTQLQEKVYTLLSYAQMCDMNMCMCGVEVRRVGLHFLSLYSSNSIFF